MFLVLFLLRPGLHLKTHAVAQAAKRAAAQARGPAARGRRQEAEPVPTTYAQVPMIAFGFVMHRAAALRHLSLGAGIQGALWRHESGRGQRAR